MCRILTLICLLLYFLQPVRSQPAALVRTITVEDGLPQGWVTNMVQDHQGFVWMASKGVSRYDGRSFIHYQHRSTDTASLAGNQVRYLFIDDHGYLWIMFTDTKAIDVIATATGHIRHISAEPAFAWLQTLFGATEIVQQAGQYFYGNRDHLVSFDFRTGKRRQISLPANEKLLAYGSRANGVLFSTDKALYVLEQYRLKKIVAFPYKPVADTTTNQQINQRAYLLSKITWSNSGNLLCPAIGGFFVYQPKNALANYIPNALSENMFDNFSPATEWSFIVNN